MKQCNLCNKGSVVRGTRKLLRGHYNPTGKRRRYPNIQSVALPDGKRVSACMQCRRTLHKQTT